MSCLAYYIRPIGISYLFVRRKITEVTFLNVYKHFFVTFFAFLTFFLNFVGHVLFIYAAFNPTPHSSSRIEVILTEINVAHDRGYVSKYIDPQSEGTKRPLAALGNGLANADAAVWTRSVYVKKNYKQTVLKSHLSVYQSRDYHVYTPNTYQARPVPVSCSKTRLYSTCHTRSRLRRHSVFIMALIRVRILKFHKGPMPRMKAAGGPW